MLNQQNYLTQEGLDSLEQKLRELKEVRRPTIAARLKEVMDEGGELGESAEYEDAKNEQAYVENEIARLTRIINTAQIIKTPTATDVVQIGARVTVVEKGYDEEEVYHLVGSAEANPQVGKVSIESPVGKALLGAKLKDKVIVKVPDGDITFVIKKIN
jgi:transcription elongation factor GreA